MTFDSHHHRWNERQEAALNRCVVDRSLVAAALVNLLTAIQLAMPNMAPAHLLRAEEEAVRALSIVGGPIITKTGETPC